MSDASDKITQFENDISLANQIVNGDDGTDVAVESGSCPTFRKTMKGITDAGSGAVALAEAAAATATSEADRAQAAADAAESIVGIGPASETDAGIIEVADEPETIAGTVDNKAVSPKNLKAWETSKSTPTPTLSMNTTVAEGVTANGTYTIESGASAVWSVPSDITNFVDNNDGTFSFTAPNVDVDTDYTIGLAAKKPDDKFQSEQAASTISVTDIPVQEATIVIADADGWNVTPDDTGIQPPAHSVGVNNYNQIVSAQMEIVQTSGELTVLDGTTASTLKVAEEIAEGDALLVPEKEFAAGAVTAEYHRENGIIWCFDEENYTTPKGSGSTVDGTLTPLTGTEPALVDGWRECSSETYGWDTDADLFPPFYMNSTGWCLFFYCKNPTGMLSRQYPAGPYLDIVSKVLKVADYGVNTGAGEVTNAIPDDTPVWCVLWSNGTNSWLGWLAGETPPSSLSDFPSGNVVQLPNSGIPDSLGTNSDHSKIYTSGSLGSFTGQIKYAGICKGGLSSLSGMVTGDIYSIDISSAGLSSAPAKAYKKEDVAFALGAGVTDEYLGAEKELTWGSGSTATQLVFTSTESIKDKIYIEDGKHNNLAIDGTEHKVSAASESESDGTYTTTVTLSAALSSVPEGTETVAIPDRCTNTPESVAAEIVTDGLKLTASEIELTDDVNLKRLAMAVKSPTNMHFKSGKIYIKEKP